jgi:hypothetical protein
MATQESPEWEALDLQESPEVRKYLSRDVKAVQLLEKVLRDKMYPGLILDGASGVGKTQQVFAMLKNKKPSLCLVYQLLIPQMGTEQPIYKEMRRLNAVVSNAKFLTLVDRAIVEANRGTTEDDDPFSVDYLQELALTAVKEELDLGGADGSSRQMYSQIP